MKSKNLGIFIGLFAILLAFVLFKNWQKNTIPVITDNETQIIKLGYIIYPPLLSKNASTGELSGVSYDIVEAVANKLNIETEWTEEVGWGTALEGLKTNRYDVLGTQMWPNKEREAVADFSIAPMNSVLYLYVRSDDNRFDNNLNAINSSEVRISTIDGELAVFIATEDYPEAQLLSLSQLSSYAEVFLNIVQNKADVGFNEPSAVNDFLESQPGTIKQVGNEPVRSFGNSFAFKKGNTKFMTQWNSAIQELIISGEVETILQKNEVLNHYSVN